LAATDGGWDGERYQEEVAARAAAAGNPHGEADFVMALAPRTVLDAGCGTGRVALELARRGVEAAGVDSDASMIATARRLGPDLEWVHADICGLDLGRRFDVVVMAGNVVLFTPGGTQAAVVDGCARHLGPGGALVCGFQLDRGYDLAAYDADCRAAGLEPAGRWATWGREPFSGEGAYAVSVHRPAG
jgi:SAM-dependent methyltransferase